MQSLLQFTYPDELEALEYESGELAASGYDTNYGYRVAPDNAETDSWQNGAAYQVMLSVRYLDIGTDPIYVTFSDDGVNAQTETVVAKTDTGKWKWKHYTLTLPTWYGHDVFALRNFSDFYLDSVSELCISSVKVKRVTDNAEVKWLPQLTNAQATDGEALDDGTISAKKFNTSIESDNFVAGVSGWKIWRATGSAEFNDVTVRGTLHATAGDIANWLIGVVDANTLSADSGKVKLNSATPSISLGESVASNNTGFASGKGIWQGKYGASDWRWRVGDPSGTSPLISFDNTDLTIRGAGIAVYNGATQTGNIDKNGNAWFGQSSANKTIQWWATGGSAGDVRLGGSGTYWLWDDSAGKVQMDGTAHEILSGGAFTVYGAIKSDDYVSGDTGSGWRIGGNGAAVFRSVRVRGEISTAVFVKDLISARAGSAITANSAGMLGANMVVPGSGTWVMSLVDPPSTGWLLTNGDIVYAKETQGTTSATYFTVVRIAQSGGLQTYTCTFANGTRPVTYEKGLGVIGYGASGQGWILETADDSDSPRISIYTHAGAPWSTVTERVRLGKLSGISDAYFGALSGYGLWTDNIYLTGGINATSGNIAGVLSIGASGGFFQGTGTFGSPTTALKIYSSGGIGLLEMWGGGTKKVYFNSSGQLNAGGVQLDDNGISITDTVSSQNRVRFIDNIVGRMGEVLGGFDSIILHGFDNGTTVFPFVFTFGTGEASDTPSATFHAAGTFIQTLKIGSGTGSISPLALLHLKNAAPTLLFEDSTASAKSALFTQDANKLVLSEYGGAAPNLTVWDLANARVGIGVAPATYTLEVSTSAADGGVRFTGSGAGGPYLILDSTNATSGLRYNGIAHWSNGTSQWFAGIRAGDGIYHIYDVVNGKESLAVLTNNRAAIGTVTVPAWDGAAGTLHLGANGSVSGDAAISTTGSVQFSQNAYYTGSLWKAISTSQASNYYQNAGTHVFRVVGSTTAGNTITWITALTLDNTGNMIVRDGGTMTTGTTTGYKFGASINDKIGFYNTAPVAQRANANQAAAPAGGTGATAGAYDTAAHRDAAIALLNEMRTVLVNLGFMKGSA